MTEEPLRVAALSRLVWQRRLAVGIVAVLGFFGGLAYSLLRPPSASAAALVLLPPSLPTTSGTPTIGNTTQVIIAESAPVLESAATSVSPPVDPRHLKHQLSVLPLSQDVLQFTVSASTPGSADRLANAVAESYIHYVTRDLSGSIVELQNESTLLQRKLRHTQAQIATLSHELALAKASTAHRLGTSARLSSLQSLQQQITLQLNNVQGQILSIQASNGSQAASTRLLQRATTATSSSRTVRALKLGAIGLAAGLLVAIIMVLFRSRRDDTLRSRNELAAALRVPVIASLGSSSCNTARDWNELLDQTLLSPATAWNLHTVLQHLPARRSRTRTRVRVLSFSDDAPASTVGALLALAAARTGPTAYLAPRDDPFIQLRAAWSARDDDEATALAVLEPDARELDLRGTRFVISTTLVDRSDPALSSFTGSTVLSVSAGEATRSDLARLALALSDSNSHLEGMIVVNPLPHDHTSGVLETNLSPPLSATRDIRTAVSGSATRG